MSVHTFKFLDQLNLLTTLLGDPQSSSDDMFPIDARKKAINQGELHFAIDSECLREMTTGSVASQEISLPSNWVTNHVLFVGTKIVDDFEIALQDYERYYQSAYFHWYQWTESGTEKIKFMSSCANGLAYTLWFFRKPTEALDQNTDESIIPIEYREASVYWAAWQLLQQIGKTDLASQNLNVYASFVESAKEDIKRKYMDRPRPKVDHGDDALNTPQIDVQGKGFNY